ncbi:hypothetical protein [Gracilibacillus saliphilus]|uniref:hypothetical protein n=1 Tax=Gracilibacillus saliphilus TaxID=543890 RepID=UPI0013D87A93|nr:hypothetical protein [Gracilibacillus saliphilus]
MSDKKIIKIPISYDQRKINEYGDGYVPCLVSERWLQFPETANNENNIIVDVMTQTEGNKPRKLCELILSRNDLLRAIDSVEIE